MRKMMLLSIVFVLLNAVDFAITIWGIHNGAFELNPLAAIYVDTIWYPLIKIGYIVLMSLLLVSMYKQAPRLTIISLSVACTLSLAVVIFQVYGLIYYIRILGVNLK